MPESEPRTIHVDDDAIPPKPTEPPADAAAPYGYTKDGKPRRKPGPAKGTGAGRPASMPRKRAHRATSSKRPDFRPAVLTVFQSIAAPLAMLGTRDETFLADATAVAVHAPGIAEALNEIAQENPALAAVLTRLAAVGPYGALFAATVPLLAQVATNHGALPVAVAATFGAEDPALLLAQVKAEGEAMRRAAAEQAAQRRAAMDAMGGNGSG